MDRIAAKKLIESGFQVSASITPRSEYLQLPGILGLKAEFEAEGSTFEEVAGLTSYSQKLSRGLTVKIGGCEAVTDLIQAISLSPRQIVAPMIESPFAVQKFGQMMNKWDPEKNITRLINVETRQSISSLEAILEACAQFGIEGIVLGRGDLAESLGLARIEVDSSQITDIASDVLLASASYQLFVGIGGGVSSSSIGVMQQLTKHENFAYFETRKVLIDAREGSLLDHVRSALAFELSWLEERAFKANLIAEGDISRIERLSRELGIR